MELEIAELEQEFRRSWRTYDPNRYSHFLAQTSQDNRPELLARLLGAELEFKFQPPIPVDENETTVGCEDDERVLPSVQLFVLRFPELSGQNEIIIRLSVLEYALRLRHDRIPPNPDSYLSLCDQSQDRLIKLLRLTENKLPLSRPEREPESVGASDSTVRESKASVSITLDPLPYNLGCFLLVKLIGKGGMGYVHSAIDLRSTAQVAVKVMRRVDPWSVYRFIEEFTWLSQLNHPNLVKLYDAFSEGDVRYFSMEMVEGKTIRQWFQRIAPDAPNRINQLRRVLAQAASAIHFLHEHGAIHCDIKCSNLMITPRRRAVLLDLGLAVREGNKQPMVGTLQYMAPEVIEGGRPSRASDWYSFGVLLYEVITDDYPPVEVDLSATELEDKYRLDREIMNDRLTGCDNELADLCAALLQSDPQSRPLGPSILQTLGGFAYEDTLVGPVGKFSGRDQELTQLTDAYRQSTNGPCKVMVVQGDSGVGKTTTVHHWLTHCDRADDLLLTIRCYRQDHTPLRLLNMLVQELVQVLKDEPESLWWHSLEERVKDIGAAFPQIRQLVEDDLPIGSRPQSATPAYLIKSKGVQQLGKWISDLSQSRAILLFIDDAQWADQESLRLIADLMASNAFRGFVIAVDETSPSTVSQTIEQAQDEDHSPPSSPRQEIHLGPLPESAAIELLSSWAHRNAIDITPSIAKNISQRAGGSPFLLQELFRAYSHYAKRDGVSDEQWLNSDSQSNVRRRFSLLPIQSENVLQYLAVAGQSINFHQLQMVSRILPHELQRTLSLLASQGWVRSRSNDMESDLEIAHENFRKIVLASLPTERLHRRHFRMARMLSSEVPPPWSRMAQHYWNSERYREATACYYEAARAAMKSWAFKQALEFLDRVDHPDVNRSTQGQEQVARLRADCLSGFGSSTAAAEIYDTLSQTGDSDTDQTLNQCLAGEQWIRAGQLDEGLNRLREVLRTSGVTSFTPSSRGQLSIGFRTLKSALFDSPNKILSASPSDEPLFSELDQCLNRVSLPLTFLDNQLGPDLILRLKDQAQRRGSEFDRSLAVLHWGMLLSLAGGRWRKTALKWLACGRRLAAQSGGPAALGSAQLCMFIWHIQRGLPGRAMLHGRKAINRLTREPRNLQWEIQFVQWGLLGCCWNTAQLDELRKSTQQLRQSAIDRSDPMSQFWMNVAAAHLADLVADDVTRAQQAIEISEQAISNQSFQSPRFFLWLTRIQQALYEGQPERAHRLLQDDWRRLENSYVFRTNHYRWMALCLRLCCNLVCLRERCGNVSQTIKDTRRSIRRLARLSDPAFAAYAAAFQLVLDATLGRQAPDHSWQSATDRLTHQGHLLPAAALCWHRNLNESETNEVLASVPGLFTDQGCVAPQKLMNIILPLPRG